MNIDFSRWVEQGYSVFPASGKFPHFAVLPKNKEDKPTWLPYTQRSANEEEITHWQKENGYTGVCAVAGEISGIIAIDWDCFNDYPEILKLIPDSPIIRVGKSPKWMRFYKYNKDLPSEKVYMKCINNVQDGIELLTNGRYFIGDGMHPDTKKAYFYVSEHLLNVDKNKLPEFPLENWKKIRAICAQTKWEGRAEKKSSLGEGGRHNALISLTGKLITLRTPHKKIVEKLLALDESFPSSYFKTHKNTPEKMIESVMETHERKEVVKYNDTGEHLGVGDLGLDCSPKGVPYNNLTNAYLVLSQLTELKDSIWFDEFHCKFFTNWGSRGLREWSDVDDIALTFFIQNVVGLNSMRDSTVNKAVQLVAMKNTRNEPRDWVKTLKWDGVARVETFLPWCLGAKDSAFTRAVSKNLWVGMIARLFSPGCKLDTMIVLEGEQGVKKSTALAAMVGKAWFSEANKAPKDKDFYVEMQGKLLIEISELEAFNKAETTTIKRLLSCNTDRLRMPYGRVAKDFGRQSIFIGTTNEEGYLKDTTGNRRFWPIRVGTIDIREIEEFREMYFAEALHLFKAGASWWEVPQEEAHAEQEERRQHDVWEDIIEVFLNDKHEVTVADVSHRCLSIPVAGLDMFIQKRISRILKSLGWEKFLRWDAEQKKPIKKWRKKKND